MLDWKLKLQSIPLIDKIPKDTNFLQSYFNKSIYIYVIIHDKACMIYK